MRSCRPACPSSPTTWVRSSTSLTVSGTIKSPSLLAASPSVTWLLPTPCANPCVPASGSRSGITKRDRITLRRRSMSAGIALELYTLREQANQDFVGMLKEVASAGYDAVEFAGYGGIPAAELRQIIDDLGLRAI